MQVGWGAVARKAAPHTAMDQTARTLTWATDSRAAAPAPAASARAARPATLAPVQQLAGPPVSSPSEADQALRYLEAEWSMRMEAPLSHLNEFEASLSRSIDAAAASLNVRIEEQ